MQVRFKNIDFKSKGRAPWSADLLGKKNDSKLAYFITELVEGRTSHVSDQILYHLYG